MLAEDCRASGRAAAPLGPPAARAWLGLMACTVSVASYRPSARSRSACEACRGARRRRFSSLYTVPPTSTCVGLAPAAHIVYALQDWAALAIRAQLLCALANASAPVFDTSWDLPTPLPKREAGAAWAVPGQANKPTLSYHSTVTRRGSAPRACTRPAAPGRSRLPPCRQRTCSPTKRSVPEQACWSMHAEHAPVHCSCLVKLRTPPACRGMAALLAQTSAYPSSATTRATSSGICSSAPHTQRLTGSVSAVRPATGRHSCSCVHSCSVPQPAPHSRSVQDACRVSHKLITGPPRIRTCRALQCYLIHRYVHKLVHGADYVSALELTPQRRAPRRAPRQAPSLEYFTT